ncbi:MAG: Bro-N domain-containing protein [Bacteroidales bacterium]|jgi:hypothetical protein|nr:Bro-N domain-containing protein [Bacteroidales bacterium]
MKSEIQFFEKRKVRSVWNEDEEEWYFSIVDVVAILTESPEPRKYWSVLKTRLKKEGVEMTTICSQLKMLAADGKNYLTDVANTKQLFRIIQSIPSKKAEPFKLWLAEVAKQRLDQIENPELSIEQAMRDYRRLGYSEEWINTRLQSIQFRKELTDQWKKSGVEEGLEYAILTNLMTKEWSGKTAAEFSKTANPVGLEQSKNVALDGAKVAKNARKNIEQRTGKSAISSLNAKELSGRKNNKIIQ